MRAPLQARSRRTLERILAAGWELLEEGGPEALTVQAITRRARTSVGSFYARFQGKDDLLRYMAESAFEGALRRWETVSEALNPAAAVTSADDPLRDTLEEAVRGLGALYLTGPGRELALMEGIEDPSPTRRRRLEDRLADELGRRLGGSRIRAELAVRVLAGTLHDAAVRSRKQQGVGASPYPSATVLLPELVELLTGYLGGEVRPPEVGAELVEAEPEAAVAPETGPWEPADSTPEPEPSPEPEAAPAPEPEVAPAKEPDPFEVWG